MKSAHSMQALWRLAKAPSAESLWGSGSWWGQRKAHTLQTDTPRTIQGGLYAAAFSPLTHRHTHTHQNANISSWVFSHSRGGLWVVDRSTEVTSPVSLCLCILSSNRTNTSTTCVCMCVCVYVCVSIALPSISKFVVTDLNLPSFSVCSMSSVVSNEN